MRSLRVVHPTDSGSLLVLETDDGAERFALAVDDSLRSAVHVESADVEPAAESTGRHEAELTETAGATPRMIEDEPDASPARVPAASVTGDPPIGPREIQVRVRAGESPAELAEAYVMTLERIMRFAAPVVSERLRIAHEARRARARRSTAEAHVVVFGEAVDERFAAHGIAPSAVSWDSYRREDGEWIVVASWFGGDRRHSAEWVFSRASRNVHPADETAVDLLSDRPIRPIAPPAPEPPQLRVAPPLVPGLVAFPPMPDAQTGPVPHVEEVFDQDAASLDAPRAVPPPADERFAATPLEDFDFEAAPLPLGIAAPLERAGVHGVGALHNLSSRREESEDDRAARARIPSWDDIVLGVRRTTD
ncbi:septation protein SepH [uncultured Jatrophihabitans sp.]|uniref:septation protein SepH n=1 Tax=uncultured Jatrophihabitans sp. TaxID=1610747 RepID=UPI0035CC355D